MDSVSYDEMVGSLKEFFENLSDLGPNPSPEDVQAALEGVPVDEASPEEFTAAVKQALLDAAPIPPPPMP